jgi:asparagine synthase (glutamine-hydrolysing)
MRRCPATSCTKLAPLLDDPSPDVIYRRLVSQWDRPDEVAARGGEPRDVLWDASVARDFPDFVARM